jgi:hypothetical protein
MIRLNKYQKIFGLHITWFFFFAGLADLDAFVDHKSKSFGWFGIILPMEFWVMFVLNPLLLALVIISWRGATEASSQILKRFFRIFRWLELLLVAQIFGFLCLEAWVQWDINSILKSVPD